MMRSVVVLGCAALLAIGLSVTSFAGSIVDADSDGVPDSFDNCSVVANGPLASTNSCNGQEDGDLDGYGNPCDTDTDNDGATSLADVSATFSAAAVASTDPNFDFDCDGAASLADVSRVFSDAAVAAVPGPSGLACAGTIPCVAQ